MRVQAIEVHVGNVDREGRMGVVNADAVSVSAQ